MIKEAKPLPIAEVKEILKEQDTEKSKELLGFLKKFNKTTAPEAKKMFDSIKKLNIEKLKDEDIVRIIDFAPEDAEDLRKLFVGSDIALDQDETTRILEIKKAK
jgi:DNA-directed RNA polymerase subunit F